MWQAEGVFVVDAGREIGRRGERTSEGREGGWEGKRGGRERGSILYVAGAREGEEGEREGWREGGRGKDGGREDRERGSYVERKG